MRPRAKIWIGADQYKDLKECRVAWVIAAQAEESPGFTGQDAG